MPEHGDERPDESREAPADLAQHVSDAGSADLAQRVSGAGAGLESLLERANEVWQERGRNGRPGAVGAAGKPGWRAFEDAFPTFYQFTNKPR